MSDTQGTSVIEQPTKGTAVANARQMKTVSVRIGERFNVSPSMVVETVRQLVFRPKPNEVITDADICAYLIVVDEYGFNPFLRECYAFKDKWGNIQPVVGVDGWIRLGNEAMGWVDVLDSDGRPMFYENDITDRNGDLVHGKGEQIRKKVRLLEGVEFEWEWEGGKVGKVPISCTAIVHRRDRERPTVVTEYFDECYMPDKEPWKKWPKRMLRHKALIQGYRVAFGFTRIIDEDEMERILSLQGETLEVGLPQQASAADVQRQLSGTSQQQIGAAVEVDAAEVDAKAKPARASMDRQGGSRRRSNVPGGTPGDEANRPAAEPQAQPEQSATSKPVGSDTDDQPSPEDWQEQASQEMAEASAGPDEEVPWEGSGAKPKENSERLDRIDFVNATFNELGFIQPRKVSLLKRFGATGEEADTLDDEALNDLCHYLKMMLKERDEEDGKPAANKPAQQPAQPQDQTKTPAKKKKASKRR